MNNTAVKRFSRSKKAQISIFIIIGVVLVLSFAALIVVSSLRRDSALSPSTSQAAAIPSWAAEINSYVLSCIQKIGVIGFKKIGLQGGYIDMLNATLSGKHFVFSRTPTESDGVLFSLTGFHPIPYWFYLKDKNDCSSCGVASNNYGIQLYLANFYNFFDYGLKDMEFQAEKFIQSELPGCINDFSSFKSAGYNITYGNITPQVSIGDRDVTLAVDFPVTIGSGGKTTAIPSFISTLDLRLKEIYQLAALTTLYQINFQFLENITLFLVDANSIPPDPGKMPPRSYTDHSFATAMWGVPLVKENLKTMLLAPRIKEIQINRTRNAVRRTSADPITQGIYNLLFLDLLLNESKDLEVDFMYSPSWGDIYFDINPKQGILLTPDSDRTTPPYNLGPPEQTNNYEFFYDISYPVVVIIRDNRSLLSEGEKGYTFRFALEANIRGNRNLLQCNTGDCGLAPFNYGQVTGTYSGTAATPGACAPGREIFVCTKDCLPAYNNAGNFYFGKSVCGNACCNDDASCEFVKNEFFTCSLTGTKYNTEPDCAIDCTTITNPPFNINTVQTVLCDPEQRLYDNLTISAIDAKTTQPISDVSITWGCGNAWECPMEKTGEDGAFSSKFPFCSGDGYLLLAKQGYLAGFKPHLSTTNLLGKKSIPITLEPIRRVPVQASSITVTNLFRIKRALFRDMGNSIIDDLYHETSSSFPAPFPGAGASVQVSGYLKDLMDEVEQEFHSPTTSGGSTLTKEGQALMDKLYEAKANISRAKSLVETYKFWHDMGRENVIEASYLARGVLTLMYNLLHDDAFVEKTIKEYWANRAASSGSPIPYTFPRTKYWNIGLPAPYTAQITAYFQFLQNEMKNIVFLQEGERKDPAVIERFQQASTPLQPEQELFITVQKKKDSPYEQETLLTQAIMNQGSQPFIELVPGTFDLFIQFRDNAPFTIPPSGYLPSIDYGGGLFGGIEINPDSRQWSVAKGPLDANTKVQLYFFRTEATGGYDEVLGEVGDMAYYSKRFRKFIEPEFVS
ncbi:hypothetical protein HYV84_06235 [Candidatus Woesearchaeota archaeon]|nr:hypothetical protein [Candidatus Woesearchaeota archaeon]